MTTSKRTVLQPAQPAPVGPDPEAPLLSSWRAKTRSSARPSLVVKSVNRPSFKRFESAAPGADPEGALAILVITFDRVVRQALLGGEGGEPSVLQAVQSAGVGPDPEAALPVFVEGEDAVVRHPHVGGEDLEAAVLLQAVETAVRADPKAPLPVFVESEDGVVRKALLPGEGGEAAVVQAVQPAPFGADPEAPLAVLDEGPGDVARESFGRGEAVKRTSRSRFRPPTLVPIQRLPSRSSCSA